MLLLCEILPNTVHDILAIFDLLYNRTIRYIYVMEGSIRCCVLFCNLLVCFVPLLALYFTFLAVIITYQKSRDAHTFLRVR